MIDTIGVDIFKGVLIEDLIIVEEERVLIIQSGFDVDIVDLFEQLGLLIQEEDIGIAIFVEYGLIMDVYLVELSTGERVCNVGDEGLVEVEIGLLREEVFHHQQSDSLLLVVQIDNRIGEQKVGLVGLDHELVLLIIEHHGLY